jgi:membrane-bound metal-dependent hydrolase YbcI (DUF457 family)
LILAAGLIAGASLPDQIEGVIGFDALGGRHSILPHRSISHWPPVWIALGALALWLLPTPFSTIVGGLAFGALLHLAIDIGSPMGIPILVPTRNRSFGDRRPGYRPYVYRTGTLEEWRVLAPIACLAALALMTHQHVDQTAAVNMARSLNPHLF